MKEAIKRFWNDEEGATAIEYGLIAGLISVVIETVLGLLGDEINKVFEKIKDALVGANAKP